MRDDDPRFKYAKYVPVKMKIKNCRYTYPGANGGKATGYKRVEVCYFLWNSMLTLDGSHVKSLEISSKTVSMHSSFYSGYVFEIERYMYDQFLDRIAAKRSLMFILETGGVI